MQCVKQFAPAEIVLELELSCHDSTALPYIQRTGRSQLTKLLPILQELDLQPSIAIIESPDEPLYFRDTTDFNRWFAHYYFELNRVLERTAGHPLQRLIIGNEFKELERRPAQEWHHLTDSLRAFCDAKLVYSTTPERVRNVNIWPLVDEIGIAYLPVADGSLKRAHRTWHEDISDLVRTYEKPIYISHANVIGDHKLLQFKNKTRFWDEAVRVNGINLNTVYSTTVLNDTSQYFGWPSSPEALDYLKSYTGK
ncbi:MAG: glycoside hydrolase family 113 [Bacteroidota bacterium]